MKTENRRRLAKALLESIYFGKTRRRRPHLKKDAPKKNISKCDHYYCIFYINISIVTAFTTVYILSVYKLYNTTD